MHAHGLNVLFVRLTWHLLVGGGRQGTVLGMEAQWLARLYPEALMSLWERVTENIVVTMGNDCQEEKCSRCWAGGAMGGGTGRTVQQEAEITEISEGGHGGRLG